MSGDLTEPTFSAREKERYARHFSLAGVGVEGQARLKAAAVLCIGAGGLGSPVLLYLAAAGVGRIGIVDADVVERSNLQRQILHGEAGLGRGKLDVARERLADLNPDIEVEVYKERFGVGNAMGLIAGYDVLVDGTDNFPTRYLSNDAAYFAGKPNVFASILRFEGQVSVFAPHLGGPCYRCLLPEPPLPDAVPDCAEAGVFGALPGVLGSMQAMEVLKLILGIGEAPIGRLIHYDALRTRFREFRLRRDPACPLCGDSPSIRNLQEAEGCCGLPVVVEEGIGVEVLRAKLAAGAGWQGLLLDVREPHEVEVASIAGSENIPLGQLPDHLDRLKDRYESGCEILVHCKSGRRSAKAVGILRGAGFNQVHNVLGGMDAWLRG